VTLHPLERTPVSSQKDAGYHLVLVWTLWRREKSLVPAGIQTLDLLAGSLVTTLTTQHWHTIYPNSKGNVHISLTTCPKLLWNQFSTSTPLLHPHGTGERGSLHL